MNELNYNAVKFGLSTLIKSVFGDNLVTVQIDNYDDAQKTECLIRPFEIVKVITHGHVSGAKLREMAWHGCNLYSLTSTAAYGKKGSAVLLYFDCMEYCDNYQIACGLNKYCYGYFNQASK